MFTFQWSRSSMKISRKRRQRDGRRIRPNGSVPKTLVGVAVIGGTELGVALLRGGESVGGEEAPGVEQLAPSSTVLVVRGGVRRRDGEVPGRVPRRGTGEG